MPLQRRLPKRGFKSLKLKFNAEVTLGALDKLVFSDIDLISLKQAGLVGQLVRNVKIIGTGTITKVLKINGVLATAAAKKLIETAGGTIA